MTEHLMIIASVAGIKSRRGNIHDSYRENHIQRDETGARHIHVFVHPSKQREAKHRSGKTTAEVPAHTLRHLGCLDEALHRGAPKDEPATKGKVEQIGRHRGEPVPAKCMYVGVGVVLVEI